MSLTPSQTALAAFEVLALLVGAALLLRLAGSTTWRSSVLQPSRLARWEITGAEVALLLVTVFLVGFVGQGLAARLIVPAAKASSDRAGMEVIAYGLGFHGFALLGWPVFALLRRRLYSEYQTEPPPTLPLAAGDGLLPTTRNSVLTVLLALPVLLLASAGWTALLRAAGLPDEPQDLIAIFGAVKSPWIVLGLLFVACVVGPLNEELIFRAGLFRYLRQRFGRPVALAVSAAGFGALHLNWAGFLPLALLGAALALAYERTGDIRVPILAHGLFNLNTILIILSGLPGVS